MDQVRLVRGDHQLGPVSYLQFRGTTLFHCRDRKPPLEPRPLFGETCGDIYETGHGRLVVAGTPDGSDE